LEAPKNPKNSQPVTGKAFNKKEREKTYLLIGLVKEPSQNTGLTATLQKTKDSSAAKISAFVYHLN